MPSSSGDFVARVDGASRGNPGPAAYAVIVTSAEGAPMASLSKFLGETTNNFAEYQGLLAALEYALEHRHRRLRVLTDSELMARQINGLYKVKSADLKPLYDEARRRISQLEAFAITHVPREENRDADRLANQTLDAAGRGSGPARPVASDSRTAPGISRVSATYQQGILKPHRRLELGEGEVVDIEIRRRP